MTKQQAERWALVSAGVVIVGLTAGAFWLSYAHLAEVAGLHGLSKSPVRQWAWPATLDAFIVAGELLMLRAGLRGTTDGWAIGLTAAGSIGSIVLNVAGVTGARDAATVPLLDYVVAAVPPTAALLAFGVLMRQVHQLVADADISVSLMRDTTPTATDPLVSPAPEELSPLAPVAAPTAQLAPANPLVICEGHLDIPAVPPRPRLDSEEARLAIEQAWRDGLSIREAARVSTRSASQVQRLYARLDAENGTHTPDETELEVVAA
ncbi:DUF2637 domain-containing protein [Streptomyces sp. NPDC059072]|uniref:DUF2637 domain-containing protein n=1 Tax=Streptomyces sp. NPDC059072 TaxID=3346715 RepID=UPI0036788111